MPGDDTAPDLFDTEGFHRALVDASVNPFVVFDTDFVIRYASSTIGDVIGWSTASLVGVSVVDLLSPESLDLAFHGLAEMSAAADHPRWVATSLPLTMRAQDGSWQSVDVMARPMHLDRFEGFLVQVHPSGMTRGLSGVVSSILDSCPADDVLDMLPPLMVSQIPRADVTIGLDWDGSRFARVHGDRALFVVGDDERMLIDEAIGSDAAPHDVFDRLSTDVQERARDAGHEACWIAPISTGHRRHPAGVIIVWHWFPGDPGVVHQSRIARVVDLARLILEWDDQQRELTWQVTHDRLTGLVNRTEFLRRSLDAQGTPRSVLFCDLDDFKPVNDLHGHRAGDRVLEVVGDRMRRVCGDHLVARLSGDEFAVLIEPAVSVDGSLTLARALCDAVRETIRVGDVEVSVGVSVGAAHDDDGGVSSDRLLDEADRMMRACKAEGKNDIRSVRLSVDR